MPHKRPRTTAHKKRRLRQALERKWKKKGSKAIPWSTSY